MGFGEAWAQTKGRAALWIARNLLGVKKGEAGEAGAGLHDLDAPDEPASRRQIATAAAYRHNPWVYAGSRKLAYSCGTVPPVLKKKIKDANGNARLETVTEHEALDVIANPGAFYGWDAIVEACVWNLLGWGRAFVEQTGRDTGAKTVGFFPLKSRYMTPKGDAKSLVAGYEYTPNSKTIFYKPEQIVFVKFYDPDASDLKGLSPLEAAHHSVNIAHDASEMVDAALDNNLMTGLVLKSPGELTRAQVVRIYQQLEHRLAGPRKAFRPLIVGGGMEPVNVGNSMKDADFSGLLDSARQEIMAALGVPPIKLGMLEGASFSNAREQNRHFWRESIPPILTRIYDAFNRAWLWPEYGREYVLVPDPSAVFVDEEDMAERENRTIRRWSGGVITLNEARERLGETPLEDTEVGDKFQWELRAAPAFPNPGGTAAVLPDAASVGKSKPFAKRRWDPDDVNDFAKAMGGLQEGAATKFSALMLRVFQVQRDDVMRAVGESLAGVRDLAKDAASDEKAAEAAAKKALHHAFANYADDFQAAYLDLIDKAATATAEQTGFDGSKFDLSHARIGKYVDAKPIRLSRQINETTLEAVKSAIKDGITAGDSVPEIEDRVREAFGDAIDPNLRPALIARTETTDAASFASVEAMKQSGVVDKKEWLSTEDELVRPNHQAADGQQVGVDDPFRVGGEALRWPGDTENGSPGNVINCLPGDQRVAGRVIGASKARYSGPMVDIKAENGSRLSVTVNHPVLTARGFVRAGDLREGDDLICEQFDADGRSSLWDVQDQNRPPQIEQVFEAIAAQGACRTLAPAVRDFYGDGRFFKGEIEIVSLHPAGAASLSDDLELIGEDMAAVSHGRDEFQFVLPDFPAGRVNNLEPSAVSASPSRAHLPSHGLGVLSQRSPLENFRVASASGGNACVSEYAQDDHARDAVTLRQSEHAGSGREFGHDFSRARRRPFGGLRLGAAANLYPSISGPSGDSVRLHAQLAANLRSGFPGRISTNRVVSLRVRHFEGSVFDLHTAQGYFAAGQNATAIVIQNCRCVVLPVVD